jgi:hypothetical protein
MPKAKLRQDNIRSLEYVGAAHGKAQCIYWDLALPGFGLRKFPNGRGSYVCSYRVQKRKRLVDLGRSDSITLEQARRFFPRTPRVGGAARLFSGVISYLYNLFF